MVDFHIDDPPLVVSDVVLELVFVFQLVSLVEFWDPAVVFEEEVGVAEHVEVDDVFDGLFDSWQIALCDLVGSLHVNEPNVEEDESARHHTQLVNDQFPFLPFLVGDHHSEASSKIEDEDWVAGLEGKFVPFSSWEVVEDWEEADESCDEDWDERIKHEVQLQHFLPGSDLQVGNDWDEEACKDEGGDEFPLEFWVDAQIEEDVSIEAGERDGYGEVKEVEEEWLAFPFPEVDGFLKFVLDSF